MKIKLIISSLLVSSVFMSAVHAADGAIKFTGKITASACKVDSGSMDQPVNMGTVSSNSFNGMGSTSSPTRFSIKLTDCPKEYKNAYVKFDGQTDRTNNWYLALQNNGSEIAAQGVALAIYELNDSSHPLAITQRSMAYPLIENQSNVLSFVAKYIATGDKVTAGSGNSLANFTITYN
ncbi:fimbrial protein [Xenorhabdus szentirmaii]|uniref:fimbrial protein n=1 Tax=Xenorhabdus szentirmaii TaxID=290112 RepID=UPI0019A40A00|nr:MULTISPECIES: fimbrial protein [unclassified Xenorhabdus]MBD2779229.1 fimbrial protein [Xenorhabdus sp. 38]MBD2805311.1 fimbrial protein [Xenorhabdus sp. ZM]